MNGDIGKNVLYTSVSGIVQAILTLLFWLITAKIVNTETIGLTSAIVAFVTIVTTISGINMSFGMKRILGIAISEDDMGKFKQFLTSTVVFVAITSVISSLLISIPKLGILGLVGIDYKYAWMIITLIPAIAFQSVFSESLVSANRSKNLVLPILISSLLRFPILFVFIYLFNEPTIGTIIAYSSVFFISATAYGIYSFRLSKGISIKTKDIISNFRYLTNVSLVSWIPQMVSVLSSQLSIITVFAMVGSSAGGKFYIPMMIVSISLFLVSGINRVIHPLVAGMETREQQVNFLAYAMKIAFVLTIPLVIPLVFFGNNFLGFLNEDFSSAGTILQILMIGFPLSIINEMVYYFVYGRGDNNSVLYLGLVGTVSRIILYFPLVPIFHGNGAALAILFGTILQFALSVWISKKHFLIIQYKNYIVITLIPLAIGTVLWKLEVHFIISSIIIFFSSFLVYAKLHLFIEDDLRNVLYSCLPRKSAQRVYPLLSKLMKKIS